MTKQNILDTIEDSIIKNDDGLITAEIVKSILEDIVGLLPSTDAEGSVVIKSVVKDYLTSGTDITLSVTDAGKLGIAFTGTIPDQLTGDEIRTEVFGSVEGGDEITVTTNPDGKLVISVSEDIITHDEVLNLLKSNIEVTSPIHKTFDDTSKKLTLSLGGYDPNSAFNNSASLRNVKTIGLYTLTAYNEALYDTFNVDETKFMLPPENSEEQGILIHLYEDDSGFIDYIGFDLTVSIYQVLNNGGLKQIIEGPIKSFNNPNQRKLFISLETAVRNEPERDRNIAQPLYYMFMENNIKRAINNAGGKDDTARENAITAINEARTAETTANLARTEAAAVKVTADLSLARTQRLTHITPWMYDGTARTIYIQWKPVKGLASGNTVTVRIEGITKTYTLTDGLAANDDQGLLIPFNATTSDAANILRNAVNARSGYLLCSVEDTTNGTVDHCWIPVVASMEWSALAGNSPYTIPNHITEFVFEYGKDTNTVYTQHVLRQQLSTTAKTFLHDTERPDGSHNAELGITLTLNAATLTATIRQQDTSGGTHTIKQVYAR